MGKLDLQMEAQVILMFKIWGSEAGSSACLVNNHYCCSRLTNGSRFACCKGLFLWTPAFTSFGATTVQDGKPIKQFTLRTNHQSHKRG